MTVLICTSCDAELEADGSRFCMRCGVPLDGSLLGLSPAPDAHPLPPQINRRAGRRPIAPPTQVQGVDALTVSRNWSSSRPLGERKPKLTRERKMAGDLPDWEPLPPGELTVRRPQA